MSLTDSPGSRSDGTGSALWGCELSSSESSHTFHSPQDWPCELLLHSLCLGHTARDEFHVVEVVAEDSESRSAVPIATLKPSVLPAVSLARMRLSPPVSFRLRAGNGPVYISGQLVSLLELSSDEEEEEEEDEDEEEEEESPERPPGRSRARQSRTKKWKRDPAEEQNGLSPPAPLPPKGRGAGRGRKAAARK